VARRSRGPHRAGEVFDRRVGLDDVPDGYRATADRESIKVKVQMVERAVAQFGRLNMAFNNAGIQVPPTDAAGQLVVRADGRVMAWRDMVRKGSSVLVR
jgi:NAD(P)-dependent dehydrogenase (short-subunit alcohol dehydrogenase family)